MWGVPGWWSRGRTARIHPTSTGLSAFPRPQRDLLKTYYQHFTRAKPKEVLERRRLRAASQAHDSGSWGTQVRKTVGEVVEIDDSCAAGPPLHTSQNRSQIEDIWKQTGTCLRQSDISGVCRRPARSRCRRSARLRSNCQLREPSSVRSHR